MSRPARLLHAIQELTAARKTLAKNEGHKG